MYMSKFGKVLNRYQINEITKEPETFIHLSIKDTSDNLISDDTLNIIHKIFVSNWHFINYFIILLGEFLAKVCIWIFNDATMTLREVIHVNLVYKKVAIFLKIMLYFVFSLCIAKWFSLKTKRMQYHFHRAS